MDLVDLKVLAAFVFLSLALFFGWTPLFLLARHLKAEKNNPSHSAIHYLHSLASGVLLATCLLHLLPESLQTVREALRDPTSSGNRQTSCNLSLTGYDLSGDGAENLGGIALETEGLYPVAELMVALGFLFIYGVDSTIKTTQALERHGPESDSIELGVASKQCPHSDRGRMLGSAQTDGPQNHSSLALASDNDVDDDAKYDDESLRQISTPNDRSMASLFASDESHPLAEERHYDKVRADKPVLHVRSVALVAALCIHGFFDGVMLGLQTSKRVLVSLLFALSLHKSFVAIGLSLTLFNNRQPNGRAPFSQCTLEVLFVFLFAAVAPLGLALSSVFVHTVFNLDHSGGAVPKVSVLPGCLQSFAVGTFLYVTFSELAEHARSEPRTSSGVSRRDSLVQVMASHACMASGFAFMAWMRQALGDS